MFDVTASDIKNMERDLKVFGARALPYATRNTLNQAAFTARTEAQEGLRDDLVLRNKFTERSIRVDQTKSLTLSRQEATVGSTADYLERQEFGGTADAGGKYGAVIPTSYAAGQEGARPRTKLPRKPNKMANIKLRKRAGSAVSGRQRAFLTGLAAARDGDKYVFIEGGAGASTGIYRVWGRRKVRGQYRGIKLKMVYSMRRSPTTTPANPWLQPAVERTRSKVPRIYADSLAFQLRRLGLFYR